jgi:hypothetical protein
MSARWRRIGLAAGWGIVIGWSLIAPVFATSLQPDNGGDFGMYYATAETLRYSPHANIYDLRTLVSTVRTYGGCALPLNGPYPYQPLTALLIEPLTLLPCHDAATLWRFLNFALWFGGAALLSFHSWRRHGPVRALLVAMITLFFAPILSGIHLGQVHLIMLACMMAGIALVERDHEFTGGAALGLGVMLKYFPVALVFYYLLRGRWRVGVGAILVTAALAIMEDLIVGQQTLLASIGAGERDVRYYSASNQGGHWMSSLPAGVALAYLAGAAFVVTVVALHWRRGGKPTNTSLGAGWAIATALIFSPLVWWFYMTWLLPAFLICLDVSIEFAKANRARGWRSVISSGIPFIALPLSYGLLLIPAYFPGVAHYRFTAAGTLLLWLLCGALYVWSAGVRLPDIVPWSRIGRWRAPAEIEPARVDGIGAVSRESM